MFSKVKNLFKKDAIKSVQEENRQIMINALEGLDNIEPVSETNLNNKFNKGKFIPYYDDFQDLWSVKNTTEDVCYPMTGKNMAYEITILLNTYDIHLHDTLDELCKKDRKLEDLGYDLTDLDKELNIG